MVVTIQQVVHPLLIVCFIMGLRAYPMKQPNPKIRWIAYLTGNITNSVIWAATAINTIISVIMSFYHQKRLDISLKKLSAVDNCLEELGVTMMYQRTHIYSKLVIIGWIIYSFLINLSNAMWWINFHETWALFIAFMLNYCININAFMELLFIFLLWLTGNRFDKINEHMQCLLVEDHGLKCAWKKSMVVLHQYTLYTNYKRTLWISMHLHLELCRIARELNFIFGTQITFGMTVYLVFMASLCYAICMALMQELPKEILQLPYKHIWFNLSSWIFVILIRVYAVNYMCENITIKANEINQIITRLTNTLQYTDTWKEVYQFTLQIMHHPLKLTGMNLFYFGNEYLRKFCITILTFVIIMVQMKVYIIPINGW
ncbi:PREDICTED: uncharacterized protein LOC105562318 isoform X2 [Vollenhovia emeryi]|uniref:uncharacterized protein LOC105562318 isoform X2 n=1 Tax=Vollenhovia emeryi TaxID=411798 RepID=UPI0005F42399|nr:PREDICTED: uncharacterized protein LOC105562318 isoform X2 [Vollenhovia emeryi]